MTYIDTAAAGEAQHGGAVVSRRDTQPLHPSPPTTAMRYVATGSLTRRDYGLFEYQLTAGSHGARPHYHPDFSESFYILDGELNILDGQDWVTAGVGDLVYVPRNSIHGFNNAGALDTRFLILFTPGAPREEYFSGLAELRAGGRVPSTAEIDDFARRHGQINIR